MSMDNLEEPRPDSLIGTIVDGRFDILALVGEGGIGVVYRARHVLMDRIVAFKMLRSEFMNDEIAFGRFQQEARAVCALNHPNIVAAFDFGVTGNGHAYLAMDFLEGEDLDSYIEERGALPLDQCFPLFLQICDALHHAHKIGIIHRDLKPSNIVLLPAANAPPVVKLVDFGMAKFTAGASLKALKLTKPGDVFGSPYYMSPEQFQGPDLDARSDIYSLGCLMYEALTGLPPHMGEDYLDVMRNHLAVLPEAKGVLAEPNPISMELKRIIFKTLEKSADQRYQSVADLLTDLKRLIDWWTSGSPTPPAQDAPSPVEPPQKSGATIAGGGAQSASGARTAVSAPPAGSDGNTTESKAPTSELSPGGIPKSMVAAAALLIVAALAGVFLMMSPHDGPHSGSAWQTIDEDAGKEAHAGNLVKAEALYLQAVAEAEKRGESDNPELTRSLESLAVVYQKQKKYAPAEAALKRSIAICKKQADFDSSQLSPLLIKLGELYKEQGRTDEAEEVHKQIQQIIKL